MKELMVTVGLIILGGIIVATQVLGGTNSLKKAAQDVVTQGTNAVNSITWTAPTT